MYIKKHLASQIPCLAYEFCYGVSGVFERYLKTPQGSFNLSR
jgi:hypothetical protein